MIKISNHSFKFFLTISFSLCFLYHARLEFRRHSNNKINKFDSRYWCWHCRRCCRNFAISQYRLKFCISQANVVSKYSISTATEVDFETFKVSISIRFATFRISCEIKDLTNEKEDWVFFNSTFLTFFNSISLIIRIRNDIMKISYFSFFAFRWNFSINWVNDFDVKENMISELKERFWTKTKRTCRFD